MNIKFITFSLVLIITCIGCKKNIAKIDMPENMESRGIVYYLDKGVSELENFHGVERKLNEEIYLRGFAFYEKEKNNYDLIIELQDDVVSKVVSKYTFAIEGFVSEDDLFRLSSYSKRKDRKFDAWYGVGNLKRINGRCYVIVNVKTKIRKFELMKFYLFDKDGYKGDIGQRVLIYNYEIN